MVVCGPDVDRGEKLRRGQRSRAIAGFLSAGLSPAPPKSVMVWALAQARREVGARRTRNAPIDAWLAGEVHLRGIRENAAVLAVMELPDRRAEIAAAYRREHPDRVAALDALMTALSPPP
jgi:hypothetical protein